MAVSLHGGVADSLGRPDLAADLRRVELEGLRLWWRVLVANLLRLMTKGPNWGSIDGQSGKFTSTTRTQITGTKDPHSTPHHLIQ
jgi:hypothetical protein